MIASGVICAIYVLCAAILFMGVKEQKGEGLVPSMVITKQHNISQIWMSSLEVITSIKISL